MKKFMNLKLVLSTVIIAFAIISITSCDNESNPTPTPEENVLTGTITVNTTLQAAKKYTLKGNVFVASGVTLTIEPGTTIFGDKVTKGALIIERGATIDAEGTLANPIVFTSSAPVSYRNYGDWGGVVILGKAQNNQSADQGIEGITAASNGKYGGTTDDDNSGVFTFVRIEYAGIALSTDNELNGLTMGSVGSGTKIEHVQVSYSGDDSFEWFGGTVNAKFLVAYRGWDDDFDTDFGYRGSVQFGFSVRDANIADKSGSNGFESDNDGTGQENLPRTAAKFSNITWFGPHASAALNNGALRASSASANFQFGAHMRRRTDLQIYNSILVGSHSEAVHFDKTGTAAVFKGNYIARSGVNVSKAVKKVTTGNGYDDANFATDNILEADQGTVDLSAKIAGLTTIVNINSPSALLAGGSSLLTGSATVPESLTQTAYIGAFDATTNWLTGWTNFDPNNTEY